MDDKIPIKRDGNGSDPGNGFVARIAVAEQRLKEHDGELETARDTRAEYIPRIERMEVTLTNLAERFDELVPQLTKAVSNLTQAVEKWNTTRALVVRVAVWAFGLVTTVSTSVIAAKLLKLI